MAKAYKKRSLGRGLSSILNDDENNILDQKKNKLFNEIQIDLIDLNPFQPRTCLLYTSPSPRDTLLSRMPSSA